VKFTFTFLPSFISVYNAASNITDWIVSNYRVITKLRYETYKEQCYQANKVVIFVYTQLHTWKLRKATCFGKLQ